MKLTIYGTSSSEGFPSLFCQCEYCTKARVLGGKSYRTRTGFCIDDEIMIDFGPDVLAHTHMGLQLSKVKHILFTHSHTDHLNINELHYIIEPFASGRDGKILHLYGNESVRNKLDRYFTEERYKGSLEFHLIKGGDGFTIDGYSVMPVSTYHDPNEDCLLYVIEKEGKTVLIGTDSSDYPEDALDRMYDYKYDLIIFDCTSIEKGSHFKNHMGLPDNKRMEKKLREHGCITDDTKIAVTHFAHTFNPIHEHVEKAAGAYGYIAAFDGITFDL